MTTFVHKALIYNFEDIYSLYEKPTDALDSYRLVKYAQFIHHVLHTYGIYIPFNGKVYHNSFGGYWHDKTTDCVLLITAPDFVNYGHIVDLYIDAYIDR